MSYDARVPPRLRAVFAAGSVLVSVPVLTFPAGVAGRSVAVALIAIQAAALWWLNDHPAAGTVTVLAAGAGLQIIYPGFGPGITFVVLCTYAWMRPTRAALWMLAPATLAACGPPVARGRWDLAALWLGAMLLAWSWGALARARTERRHAERRQAVLEERARIARELHDVLAHTVSVMVVQAAAADDIFDADPARARQALRRTEQAGREALAELRRFLHTVREDDQEAVPQPTLDDMDRLATTMSEAGLPVTVRREGAAEVPLGMQLGVYRIVQEALTNALRHASASRAEVLLKLNPAELYVQVTDDGCGGPGGGGGGQGLAGMRERARLLGGTLHAGPRADSGFEVSARLPLREP